VLIERLARVENRESQRVGKREAAVAAASTSIQLPFNGEIYMLDAAGFIDISKERDRLIKERAKAEGEARKIEAKLANRDFVDRAPEEVVEENRERLKAIQAEIERLSAALARVAE
jgi:valyl-tRNA synthetase